MPAFTDKLRADHREIEALLNELSKLGEDLYKTSSSETLTKVEAQLSLITKKVFLQHHQLEESLLFPAMYATGRVSQGGPRCSYYMGLRLLYQETHQLISNDDEFKSELEQSPLGIPLEEHRIGDEIIRDAQEIITQIKSDSGQMRSHLLGELIKKINYYDLHLRRHIEKEETCLFILADQILSPEEQSILMDSLDKKAI